VIAAHEARDPLLMNAASSKQTIRDLIHRNDWEIDV